MDQASFNLRVPKITLGIDLLVFQSVVIIFVEIILLLSSREGCGHSGIERSDLHGRPESCCLMLVFFGLLFMPKLTLTFRRKSISILSWNGGNLSA